VRFLPDKPSLGFLRKEAKDLLAALRESSPDAALADAQQALATEYGLRDWNALKSEAERRAASLPAAPGLAVGLAAAFGLGLIAAAATPVSFTPMGRSWSLTTDRGRWLAVTVYPWIDEAQARLGAQLRDAAVAAGIVAPTPVRSPGGRLIEAVQGENWRVHEWIQVGPSPVSPTPTAVARRIGAAYGILHSLAIPSTTPVNPYITQRGSDADWERLLERARGAEKPWAEQLARTLPVFYDLRTIDAPIDDDALILCNCNLIPSHVRTGRAGELIITEWDFAGSLTPELELGSALTQWVLRPSINHKAITAFRDGYAETAGHWPSLGLTSFAVAITGYLNWTYNTICEAITPADPEHATIADLETVDLLNNPVTPSALEKLLTVLDA
jgi:hypothetical protein